MYKDITRLFSGGSALESLSGFLGEDQDTTGNAVAAAVPALMGGLSKRSSSPEGASALFSMIQGNDGSTLDNIGGFLSSDDGGAGEGLVGSIFGSRRNEATQAVADRSGLGVGGVAKLLPALAPMVMGFLGRKQSNEGLDQASMMSQLTGEGDALRDGGFGGLLGSLDGGDDNADNAGFTSGLGKIAGLAGIGGVAAVAAGKMGKPDVNIPKVDTPNVSAPNVNTPDVDMPKVAKPEVNAPQVAKPEVSAPQVAKPEVNTPQVAKPDVNMPEAERPAGWVEREAAPRAAVGSVGTAGKAGVGAVGAGAAGVAGGAALGGEKKRGLWWLWPLLGLIALAILIPLLLTQCGGDDDEVDTTPVADEVEEEVEEVEEEPEPEPVEEEPEPEPEPEPASRFAPGRILDTADGAGNFTALLGAVEGAGLVDALDGDGPFTVFAPTDEAMAAVPDEIASDPDLLDQVLRYHVVEGAVTSDQLAAGPVTTLEGQDLTIGLDGGVTANDANVITADITADNGVIHVIDSVLIPPSLQQPTGTLNDILDLDPINFEVNSAAITADSTAILDQAVEFLTENQVDVSIGGHTDSDGSEENNLELSQARAESVMAYLIENGIDADRLTATGFGEGDPIASNDTPEGRAENRRIEFTIV